MEGKEPAMPPRVLIADPDKYLRACYQEELSALGYVVETVGDGLECLGRLRDGSPDVLVLDPAIPWGGGDGLLTLMHEEPGLPTPPVIVISNGTDRGLLYRLTRFYVHYYQVKPVSTLRLARLIKAICQGRRLPRLSLCPGDWGPGPSHTNLVCP
jgi:CheY-like chemotaxis protein